MPQISPRVTDMSWGSITVEKMSEDGTVSPGHVEKYRDAMLWPGGSCAWDWRKTGTGHIPGIQPADVDELLSHKPEKIVLSRGVLYALQVPQSTIDHIHQSAPNVQVIVENSKSARATYNRLAGEGERVAALIHTTC